VVQTPVGATYFSIPKLPNLLSDPRISYAVIICYYLSGVEGA